MSNYIFGMSNFGINGRFGNQIFQYFFLQVLKNHFVAQLSLPPWIGNDIFGIAHEAIDGVPQARISESNIPRSANGMGETLGGVERLMAVSNLQYVDIEGYFQFHTATMKHVRRLFESTYSIADGLLEKKQSAMKRLGFEARYIVGLHVRRGDYLQYQNHSIFWTNTMDANIASIADLLGSGFSNPVIYLASDDIQSVGLELNKKGVPYFTSSSIDDTASPTQAMAIDFMMLAGADAVIASNSTFSVAASMLNRTAQIFLRPSPSADKLIPYAPWNTQILLSR